MTYIQTETDKREEVIEKYLNHYDLATARKLWDYFHEYKPSIKIKKEMQRHEAVGLNELNYGKTGVIVQILRRWIRVKDNRKGKKPYPHIYFANPQMIQEGHLQIWKSVPLRWVSIPGMITVIERRD